ncbi:hypothetical protein KZX46_02710 (plasmid) [Polymorphobacter sp. PAMC 29334]|uniref:hypothetical protein n=1 Tax=Polymorphobacter sp. PAMC 29334 TaxID=2862331 RepID=UPI001C75DC44|nr:hypothetical protein [Polymorphobacter sp. PAMC 29334]QYE33057.1 hypothetical protein KZX46_02710 [Polymorphobacter sp. PAMC 29334]
MTTDQRRLPPGHPLGSGDVIVPDDDEKRAFVLAQVRNGSAVLPPDNGKLPAGATHVIVGTMADGSPVLQRARFSAY